jgi:chromatin remodeling complex protein RSC6
MHGINNIKMCQICYIIVTSTVQMMKLICVVTLITNKQCFIQLEDETGTVESGCLHQSLRKNPTEDLQLRMRAATCISKDEHIQIQSTEVVKKCTKAVLQKDGTEESASADKEALSDYRAASTVDNCKVGESDVEEEGNRRKNSSIDVSDEETGFVKL